MTSFRAALQRRLLHAGASATSIIHTYVATIRTMREIDPSGEAVGTGRDQKVVMHTGLMTLKHVPEARGADVVVNV